MAVSLQILKSTLSPFPSPAKPNKLSRCSDVQVYGRRVLRFRRLPVHGGGKGRQGIYCQIEDGGGKSSGEERPESLFMKELKKRGITPTSLLEENDRSAIAEEISGKERTKTFQERDDASSKNLTNQRDVSLALNSEGLEGLIPRGKLLLTLGGTFFLAFWPLILVTVSAFAAVYLYFGPSFIHDGRDAPVAPPQYIDPYVLLQEERTSQIAPRFKLGSSGSGLTTKTTSPSSSDETNLLSRWCVSTDGRGVTNMLVVTTSMGMLNWIHGNTTDLRPAVPLHPELVVRVSCLQERLLSTATSSNLANHGTATARDNLLGARWKLDPV
ncbi:hypothetical protein V2J09_008041 [Rumex salicifolius]